MRTAAIIIVMALALAAPAWGGGNFDRLNGTWANNIMTVVIDTEAGRYWGVALGETFDREIRSVDEYANVVIFTVDKVQVTGQFQSDGGLMLTKDGSLPLIFRREP